jgi:uncharacterized protein YlxW (UPF0749 family)
MGGFQRTHNDEQPTDSAGSPATAEGLYARLTASQEASMRQLTQERDAARTQIADLETTVKELVAAMDDTTKAKGTWVKNRVTGAGCKKGQSQHRTGPGWTTGT